MKFHLKIFFVILLILTCGFGSCKTTAIDKQKKAKENIELVEKKISDKTIQIEDKGRAFVYGANYSLEQETNRTVALQITDKFLDLAQISLGNPSAADASLVKEITDDLLQESNRKIAIANLQLAQTEDEKKKYQKEAEIYKKQVLEGEAKLQKLENSIVLLQNQEKLLKNEYESKLGAASKLADENAEKAVKWDSENSFLASLNPFSDLFKFVKKLFTLSLIAGALFIIFHVLEIIFPGLGVISTIFGAIIKLFSKFVPKAISTAGFVSDKVKDGLKSVTVGLQHTINALKAEPIEDKILDTLDEHKMYNKNDIKKFLELHTENILELIKVKQNEFQDSNTKGLIQVIKAETGLKDGKF